MKKLLILGIVMSLVGCTPRLRVTQTLDYLPQFGAINKDTPPKFSPLVILSTMKGKRFCSGTVVDNSYILTAAHCLIDEEGFMKKDEIKLLDDHGRDTGVVGLPAAVNIMLDYGLIKADLREFEFIFMNTQQPAFDFTKHNYVACGFPGGQIEAVCVPVGNVLPTDFFYTGFGAVIPGMSGGPLMIIDNPENPIVVGVISAVQASPDPSRQPANLVFSSILGLLGDFELDRAK